MRGAWLWISIIGGALAAGVGGSGLLLVYARCDGDASFDPHGPDAKRSWSCDALGGSYPTLAWLAIAAIAGIAVAVLVISATRTTRLRPLRGPVLVVVGLLIVAALLVAGLRADVDYTGGI